MLAGIKNYLLQLLYPNRCPVCGEFIGSGEYFCGECTDALTHYNGGGSVDSADGFCASFEYNSFISPAIMLLKDGTCGNSARALGHYLAQTILLHGFEGECDIIIPVPVHRRDKFARGYNQSELIAQQTSERINIPVNSRAVKKLRRTRPQKTLSKSERRDNLCGAFSVCDESAVKGKGILLIDDVCTTGSTLSEIAELLRRHGAARIYCAVCCKTPDKYNDYKNEV